jgi:hypothetical protein
MDVSSHAPGLDTLQVDFDDEVANDDDATDIPVVAPTWINNNETDFPFTRSWRGEQVSGGESQGSHLVPSYTQVQTGEGIPSAPDLPVTWWTGVIIQGEDDYKQYTCMIAMKKYDMREESRALHAAPSLRLRKRHNML